MTPKQYEAIGRLALAFNEVEVIIEEYFASILSTPERGVAVLIAQEDSVSRKIDRFKGILKAINRERPSITEQVNIVFGLLENAQMLGGKRNEYVHAYAVDETLLRIKKREERVCDEFAIEALTVQVNELSHDLDFECFELLESILVAREK